MQSKQAASPDPCMQGWLWQAVVACKLYIVVASMAALLVRTAW
jgi:hypothetical protein